MKNTRPSTSRAARALASASTLALLAVCAPVTARADASKCRDDYVAPEGRGDALTLTMRGVACFEEERFGRALRFYRAAYALSPDPLLEAAIGRSLHELGLWSAALGYYDLYLEHERGDADGRARIEERRDALRAELDEYGATLALDAAPTGATIYLEAAQGYREELGAAPMSIIMRPGEYTVRAEREGFYPAQARVKLRPGEREELALELVPQGATFNLSSRSMRRVGATSMIASAPLLLGGGALALTRDGNDQPSGYGLMLIGSVGLIGGGVLSAIGYRRDGEQPEPSVASGLILGPRRVGILWRW